MFGDVPEQYGPHDIHVLRELRALAALVLDALAVWRDAGVRADALVALRHHAEPLSDLSEGNQMSVLTRNAHAYALGVLLSFLDDPQAGHLATDLFELIAERQE